MTECSICLENIENDLFVTRCGHKFHKHCSEKLKENGHNKCPMCRQDIFDNRPNNIMFIISPEMMAIIMNGELNNNALENEALDNARIIAENVFRAVFDIEEDQNN